MKKNKKNKTLLTVLILLLAITIGYAAIATTLKINGSADVKSARWNVYWDENSIAVTEGSVATTQGNEARVTDSGKTQVEYSVELSEPGDFYEFTVDAVNEGSLNAKIAPNGVKNNVYESDGTTPKNLPDYLGYTVKYAENDADVTAGDVLEAKKGNTPTRKKYKVRVWYKTDIDPSTLNESTTETLRLVFEVDYVQGEKSGQQSAVRIIKGTKGNLQPGDIIGIGETEDFYVISSNSEKTVLLAKYNLLVGNESHDQGSTVTPMNPSTTQGYGLQSIDAISANSDTDEWKGMVAFSSTKYWDDGNGTLLSPYNANGASYDGNPKPFVYNSSLTTAPDFSSECDYETNCWYTSGYSIAYYVEQYKAKLIEMGAPSTITGRLLTFEEATSPSIGCDAGKNTCPQDSFITDTSFWLGSAYDDYGVWGVYSNYSYFYYDNYGYDDNFGVRPVIEISTSDI